MPNELIPELPKSTYLFLLVGTNPLPNYVAARLLASECATIYLLHSGGPKGTFEVARCLKTKIVSVCPSVKVIPREITETDGQIIESEIAAILSNIKPEPADDKVGLNYTGGTKPMAVHAYRVIKREFSGGCFSYLDAQSLRMFITKGREPTQTPFVGLSVTLSLDDLLALHGYKTSESRCEPEYSEYYLALAKVHATSDGLHEWKGNWDKRKQSKGWLRTERPLTTLPTKSEYPHLAPIIDVFDKYDGDTARVAQQLDLEKLDSCYTWFNGTWLEEYTLHSLKQFVDEQSIKHFGIDLKLQKRGMREFQLDVAAMYGYQLFAISCIATAVGEKAEEHLFEAFIRSRQIGGDEARYGLVSCVKNPLALQRKIEQSWDAEGKVRVFGMHDLPNLSDCLKQWFITANKERP
ncbi:MAG: hypothetical protein KJ638_01095 [Chloroflexi bacterium]|nr:hypothetical protein [Chloroflexota bacterium]